MWEPGGSKEVKAGVWLGEIDTSLQGSGFQPRLFLPTVQKLSHSTAFYLLHPVISKFKG